MSHNEVNFDFESISSLKSQESFLNHSEDEIKGTFKNFRLNVNLEFTSFQFTKIKSNLIARIYRPIK